jgi:hypothetical protein
MRGCARVPVQVVACMSCTVLRCAVRGCNAVLRDVYDLCISRDDKRDGIPRHNVIVPACVDSSSGRQAAGTQRCRKKGTGLAAAEALCRAGDKREE